jgi:hypothetical protein
MTHHQPPRRVPDRRTHRIHDTLTVAPTNLHGNLHALAFKMQGAIDASEKPC